MILTITAETGDVLTRLQALGEQMPLATVRALKRTGDQTRTAITRALAADTGLTQTVVRGALTQRDATFDNQVEWVTVTGKRIPLIQFGARQTAGGVSYRLPKGRGAVAHAFLATMRSGHRGVFLRKTRRRLPIRELFGPSLPHVMQKPAIIEAVSASAIGDLTTNLNHEIQYLTEHGAA